jgi:hypothetical protein
MIMTTSGLESDIAENEQRLAVLNKIVGEVKHSRPINC